MQLVGSPKVRLLRRFRRGRRMATWITRCSWFDLPTLWLLIEGWVAVTEWQCRLHTPTSELCSSVDSLLSLTPRRI